MSNFVWSKIYQI